MKQYNYKVVGVTFSARDGSDRQTTLKELFNEILEREDFLKDANNIKFEGYDFNGDDALAVFVNNKEIGNISADKVQEVAEIAQKATKCTITLAVNGHDLEEYEYIVDRYKNKKAWKESDPYYDEEEAKEEYDDLMNSIDEEERYSAVLHFFVPEEGDNKETDNTTTPVKEKKQYSKGSYTITFILSIVLIIMCLVLTLAQPIVGIIGIIIGVVLCVYSRKNIKAIKDNEDKK